MDFAQKRWTLVDKFVHIIQMYELVPDVILEIAYYYVAVLRIENKSQPLQIDPPQLGGKSAFDPFCLFTLKVTRSESSGATLKPFAAPCIAM